MRLAIPRAAWLGALMLAAVGAFLLWSRESDGPLTVHSRLIAGEPAALLAPDRYRQWHPARRLWPSESVPWKARVGTAKPGAEGLLLRPENKLVRLIADVELEAKTLDALEVVLDDALKGSVSVSWRRDGETFSRDRRVSTRAEGTRRIRVPLRHRAWDGRVLGLRVELFVRSGMPVVLKEIRGATTSFQREQLAQAVQAAWRVELGREVRPAYLVPPGLERSWSVEVPPAPVHLRFSFGVEEHADAAVALRVRARGGESSEDLLSFEVGRGQERKPGRWHEESLDVSSLAGRSVRFEFATSTDAPADELDAFAFLGDPQLLTPGAPEAPNVVVILVDTLRADRLSLYGHHRQTSPNLDAWAARRAVTFRTAVAPSPWTLPSHISLFTGLDALRHGLNFSDPVPSTLHLLARRLREAGYVTRAFTGGGFLGPRYGLDQGFDAWRYWSPERGPKKQELAVGVEDALAWLDSRPPEPFLLFLHTYEVHSPYTAREPHFSRFDRGIPELPIVPVATRSVEPTLEEGFRVYKQLVETDGDRRPLPSSWFPRVEDLYDSAVAYMDAQLAPLLDRLESGGLADRTAVVFTSDHGEGLGEKGHAGHAYLYDFNLLVPLVIAFPDRTGAGTVYDQQVRTVDVAPTVLELAGLPLPPGLDGVSLAPAAAGREDFVPREAWSYASSSNFGLSLRLADRFKLILNNSAWAPIQGSRELFRIDSDPGEAENLAATAAESERLAARVAQRYAADVRALRCDFSNRGEEPYRASLSGKPLIHPFRVKTVALPCPCVRWLDDRAEVDVPPGGSLTLFLEGFGDERFTVRLPGGRPGAEVELGLDLGSLNGEWSAARHRETWILGGADGADADVRCRWLGNVFESGGDSEELDPELVRQLRALGYL